MLPPFYNDLSEYIICPRYSDVANFSNVSTFSNSEELQISLVVLLSVAGLSLISALFVVISYITLTRLRSFAYRLVLMVAIADVINSCSYISIFSLRFTSSTLSCVRSMVRALQIFSEYASMFWVGAIVFTIDRVLFRDDSIEKARNYFCQLNIFCWGFSMILTGLHALYWIKFEDEVYKWLYIIYHYLPIWLSLVYIAWVNCKIWRIFQSREYGKHGPGGSKKLKYRVITNTKLLVYPMVFFLVSLSSICDKTYQLISLKQNYTLALVHYIAASSKGLLDAFAFGWTYDVKVEWISRCCPNRMLDDKYVSIYEDTISQRSFFFPKGGSVNSENPLIGDTRNSSSPVFVPNAQ